MEEYLRKIKKLNILTADEEKLLWYRYKKEGKAEARQLLIESYQPFVFKLVKQVGAGEEIMMDLIQEGNVGLIDAIEAFDPDRNIKFSTFAIYHIRGRVKDYLKVQLKPQIITEVLPQDYLEKQVERKIALDTIKEFMLELPVKEREVMEGIYLADKKAELLAREMGITLSYLYRLQKKAIKRIRGKLSSFLSNWK